jgi:L-threonylcarbamoyladenylate synthase
VVGWERRAGEVRVFHFGDPVAPLRALLARGGVVAFPTESSYALGVDPWNRTGVEAIYRIKARETGKALPVVIAGRGQLAGLGIDPDVHIVERLFAVWPAPLTVILPVARPLPASAGGGSLAVRVPDHAELRELLAALGHGLTATSANRSGGEPILDPADLGALLAGEDTLVVDGGVLTGGPPSTLVAIEEAGVVVLRTGRFPAERLDQDLGRSTARGEAPPARPTGEDEA